MLWRARRFEYYFPRPALVMGIVNVTPDSFSDGGQFADPAAAIRRGLELAAQGAEILDIGGESTRPGAHPVTEQDELERVVPVIAALAAQTSVAISIDTLKPAVARAALAAGADIVNDVAAFSRSAGDADAMWQAVAEYGAGYVAMHAQGLPATMQKHPEYADVVGEVGKFFRDRLEKLNAAGVAADQVVFDPGIGFGKTLEHNRKLLAALGTFVRLGRPVLLGVSRKSFIEKITGAKLNERLPASLACATLAVADGVQIIRAHDVAETWQAMRMTEAIRAKTNGA